jgi:hypothetical protein
VIKDVVLLAAAMVLAVRVFAQREATQPGRVERVPGPRPARRLDLDSEQPNRWLIAAALVLAVIVGTLTSLVAVAGAL